VRDQRIVRAVLAVVGARDGGRERPEAGQMITELLNAIQFVAGERLLELGEGLQVTGVAGMSRLARDRRKVPQVGEPRPGLAHVADRDLLRAVAEMRFGIPGGAAVHLLKHGPGHAEPGVVHDPAGDGELGGVEAVAAEDRVRCQVGVLPPVVKGDHDGPLGQAAQVAVHIGGVLLHRQRVEAAYLERPHLRGEQRAGGGEVTRAPADAVVHDHRHHIAVLGERPPLTPHGRLSHRSGLWPRLRLRPDGCGPGQVQPTHQCRGRDTGKDAPAGQPADPGRVQAAYTAFPRHRASLS